MNLVGVKYVGLKDRKIDNVAQTGLIWTQGQIHAVPASLVPKFQAHPDVWEIVPIGDADLPNVGLVVDVLGQTQPEVDANVQTQALEAARNANEAAKKLDDETQQAVEQILTHEELPGSFEAMTKADIAAFAQRNYGVTFDHKAMTKDNLVEAVRNTHNSRVQVA